MPNRTKGFDLSGAAGFYRGDEHRVRGSEAIRGALIHTGQSLAGGVTALVEKQERRRQEQKQDERHADAERLREEEREWRHAQDRAELTGEWVEPGTSGASPTPAQTHKHTSACANGRCGMKSAMPWDKPEPTTITPTMRRGVPTLKKQEAEAIRTKRDAADAGIALRRLDEQIAEARAHYFDVTEVARISGDAMSSPLWQQSHDEARGGLESLMRQRTALAARAGDVGARAEAVPDFRVDMGDAAPVDLNDPELRLMHAQEQKARAAALANSANKRKSRALEVQALRVHSEAESEERKATEALKDRKGQKASADAKAAGTILRTQFRAHSFKGLPSADADYLAGEVEAGRIKPSQALTEARRRITKPKATVQQQAFAQAEREKALAQERAARGLPDPTKPQAPGEQVERESEIDAERVRQGLQVSKARKRADTAAEFVRTEATKSGMGRKSGFDGVPWGQIKGTDLADALAHGVLTSSQAVEVAQRVTPDDRRKAAEAWMEEQARVRRIKDDEALADLLADAYDLYRVKGK